MRIAWFTPFSRKSAIGKYSQCITDRLSRDCKVDLWIADTGEVLDSGLTKIVYSSTEPDIVRRLHDYDLVVFNMGNYLYFHKDIYEVSTMTGGIVILHDYILHNFFAGYYFEHLKEPRKYVAEMRKLYGEQGELAAEAALAGEGEPPWEGEEVLRFPFVEKALGNAIAVISHSHFLSNIIEKAFTGPVETIYFPFQPEHSPSGEASGHGLHPAPRDSRLMLLTVGHVNSNKRIDKVVEVLGKHPEIAKRVSYTVIGPDDSGIAPAKIRDLIARYRLADSVKLLGYVDDMTLKFFMRNADIFVNLRYPPTEGASWSLVEQLYYGKPTIVTDTGFYHEIPDDCVIKIHIGREEEDIRSALAKLIEDEKLRSRTGHRGKQFAEVNFNTEKYCGAFMNFGNVVLGMKPALELADRVSSELAAMGVAEECPAIDIIADEICSISAGSRQ